MRILIDASQIPRQKSGVGTYAVQLVRSLTRSFPAHTYFVLVQSDEDAFDCLPGGIAARIRVPARIFRIFPFRLVLEQVGIPMFVLRHRLDLVHSLHYSFPLFAAKARRVVTVHDLTFFIGPQWHVPIKRRYFRLFTRLAASRADRLIAVSESTADDLTAFTGIDRQKTAVAHLGPPEPPVERSHDPDALFRRFDIGERYILFVGTLEPRKNLFNLVRAFYRLSREEPHLQLVVAGGKGWGYERIFDLVQGLRLERRVIFTGYLDDAAKFDLMRRAQLFVYPSLYEGFGIPVLEALSLGVPTITADRPALREVAGDAALFVDPLSPEAISAAIRQLLEDGRLRRELSRRGVLRSRVFSWERTAMETEAVYRSLVGGRDSSHGGTTRAA